MRSFSPRALLADALREHGFEVEMPLGGLETAFRATKRGKGAGPTVAVLAEYDALPGIGHGCGHNLIAASGLAAAIGLGAVMDQIDGTFAVIGTPAEEGGGGKIELIDAGVFEDVDAALMVHHAGDRTGAPTQYPGGTCLAVAHLDFEFSRQAGARRGATPTTASTRSTPSSSSSPASTRCASTSARTRASTASSRTAATRPTSCRTTPRAEFFVRAADRDYLEVLEEKVRNIAEGAALMTETTVEMTAPPDLLRHAPRPTSSARLRGEHARGRAGVTRATSEERGMYSTDFGNVSYVVPSVTGSFAISHEPIPGHSQQVVDASGSDSATSR